MTPIKAMAHALEGSGIDYMLHYCVRDWAHGVSSEWARESSGAERRRSAPWRALPSFASACAVLD